MLHKLELISNNCVYHEMYTNSRRRLHTAYKMAIFVTINIINFYCKVSTFYDMYMTNNNGMCIRS